MSVSGASDPSNIPGGSNWNNLPGINTPSNEGSGRVFQNPSTKSPSPASGNEGIDSGVLADYLSESQVSQGRYENLGSGTKSLKFPTSRVKSESKAFSSSFGSRKSRASANRSKYRGDGIASLPSTLPMVQGRNKLSPEMQSFYLSASGLRNSDTDMVQIQDYDQVNTSDHSLGVSHLSPLHGLELEVLLPSLDQNSLHEYIASHSSVHQEVIDVHQLDHKCDMWTIARMGGEEVSVLLDANVESSSLIRRATTIDTNILQLDSSYDDGGFVSFDSIDTSYQGSANTSKDSEVVDGETHEDANSELEGDIIMNWMFLESVPPGGFPVLAGLGVFGADSKRLFDIDTSKTVSSSYVFSSRSRAPQKEKMTSSFPPSDVSDTRLDAPRYIQESSEPVYDRGLWGVSSHSLNMDEHARNNMEIGVSRFVYHVNSHNDSYDPREFSFVFSKKNYDVNIPAGNQDQPAKNEAVPTISSSFHFSSQSGSAMLFDLPESLDDYKVRLDRTPGRHAPPDPLVYQYRAVGIDPPIILNPPGGAWASSRLVVMNTPEAEGVYEDSSGQQEEHGSGGQQPRKDARDGKKKKSRSKINPLD